MGKYRRKRGAKSRSLKNLRISHNTWLLEGEKPRQENFSPKPSFSVQEETMKPLDAVDDGFGFTEVKDVDPASEFEKISGHRIVDLGYVLSWAVSLQHEHSKKCQGQLYPKKEHSRGLGFVRRIQFACTVCSDQVEHQTERPGHKVSLINYGAVWGTLSIGSTYEQLEELMCSMDIPPMQKSMFSSIEQDLGEIWHDQLEVDLENNIEEEKSLARRKGNIDPDGVTFSAAYSDCGWSKRSWGHSYNAASGVAVIIGKLTKKILFLGVRNKYCIICARAITKNETAPQHVCYKNWMASSGAMEADIITEGFCFLEKQHSLRLKTFIGDGDSSVYAKLIEKVPYGREIKKVECTNHCIKNYGKHLYRIKSDKKISIENRKPMTVQVIKKLQNVAQKCIYACKDITELDKHLKNGPMHVFGYHKYCASFYCNETGSADEDKLMKIKQSGLYNHVYGVLEILMKKSSRLLGYETTNCAESFMSVAARFNAGKRLNLTSRGSFYRRMILAALRYNNSFNWHRAAWEALTTKSPGKSLEKYIVRKTKLYKTKSDKRISDASQPKPHATRECLAEPEKDYGPCATQPDPSPDEIVKEKTRKFALLQVTQEEIYFIEANTKDQFNSDLFISERLDRLTASYFGRVVKRRQTTPCHNLVKDILYQKPFYTVATDYGKSKECVAIRKLEEKLGVMVKKSGFFIYPKNGCLGASPDGLVGSTHVVEVKCLFGVKKLGISLYEATEKKKTCLEIFNNQLRLNRHHNYWYQIQGQLNITGRTHCYFVVYVDDDQDIFIEEIERDETEWNQVIYPALKSFYNNCILEEIARKNIPRGKKCFDIQQLAIEAWKSKKILQPSNLNTKQNISLGNKPRHHSQELGHRILHKVFLPTKVLTEFAGISEINTKANTETCGILAGVERDDGYTITHFIVPKQQGTSNTCFATHEEDLVSYQTRFNIITLGWIHSHPTQSSFLSSIDVHTHYCYQRQLAEAIAVVHAPKFNT